MKKVSAIIIMVILLGIAMPGKSMTPSIFGFREPIVIEVVTNYTKMSDALEKANSVLLQNKFITTSGIQETSFSATRTTGSRADYYVANVVCSMEAGKAELTITFVKVGSGLLNLRKTADEIKAALGGTEQPVENQSSDGWQNVTVTRNPDDVKGLKKVCDINVTAKMVFSSQTTLRKEATEKAQQQAFDKGAQIILIEEDHYDGTGIHNVNIIGEAYAKPSHANSSQPVEEVNTPVQAAVIDTLKDSDIIEMTRKKIPDEIIILKIKHSTCSFNTSADGLAKLVKSGVHEKVIEAMIQ